MSGSQGYLGALETLHDMFVNYPFRAAMSTIHIACDPMGRAAVMVELDSADPVVLAGGILEWRNTFSDGDTWAWRTPGGEEIHVATTGRAPECDTMKMIVLAGPIPHDCRLDHGLEPGGAQELDDDTLYQWLASEITNDWPFPAKVERLV